MIDRTIRQEHQYAKLLMHSFDAESEWQQDGDDWYRLAVPVYRSPQGSWKKADGFRKTRVWFPLDTYHQTITSPAEITWPQWINCYWDTQAGRWNAFPPPSSGGGGGSAVLVELEGSPYSAGEETCDADNSIDASGGLLAKIILRPCGVSSVFGETEDGYVEVFDEIGWLFEQSAFNIDKNRAFAHLMQGDYGCKWVLGIPNLFQERQFVQDWYVSGLDIIEEKVNAKVWDWCRLPDEVTPGVDCSDNYGA